MTMPDMRETVLLFSTEGQKRAELAAASFARYFDQPEIKVELRIKKWCVVAYLPNDPTPKANLRYELMHFANGYRAATADNLELEHSVRGN